MPAAACMRCIEAGGKVGATACSNAAKSTARHSARCVLDTLPALSACRRAVPMVPLM
ncbi:hypothetical protein D3C72_2304450 [compost metagenome]